MAWIGTREYYRENLKTRPRLPSRNNVRRKLGLPKVTLEWCMVCRGQGENNRTRRNRMKEKKTYDPLLGCMNPKCSMFRKVIPEDLKNKKPKFVKASNL